MNKSPISPDEAVQLLALVGILRDHTAGRLTRRFRAHLDGITHTLVNVRDGRTGRRSTALDLLNDARADFAEAAS